jgi:hypothetical protein
MHFKMTTAEMDITTGAQHSTFHAILLQDLMKRAVFFCRCGVEMPLTKNV